jgi:hypothetical protein
MLQPEQLQESAIKAIFATFDEDKQSKLIGDFMRIAKIDSVVRNPRSSQFERAEVAAETAEIKEHRLYRDRFDVWLHKILLNYRSVVHISYLDKCFKLFDFVRDKAKGIYFNNAKIGVYCRNDEVGYAGRKFVDNKDRMEFFSRVLTERIPQKMRIYSSTKYGKRLWTCGITFEDLFDGLRVHGEKVDFLLLVMVFFDDDEVLYAKTRQSMVVDCGEPLENEYLADNEHFAEMFPGLTIQRSNLQV